MHSRHNIMFLEAVTQPKIGGKPLSPRYTPPAMSLTAQILDVTDFKLYLIPK